MSQDQMGWMPSDGYLWNPQRQNPMSGNEASLSSPSTNLLNAGADDGTLAILKRSVPNAQVSPNPNTALLLAEVEALKHRCMTLENIFATRHATHLSNEDAPITGADASNHTWAPTPFVNNNSFNAPQDPHSNNSQWMDPAAGHAMNVDLHSGYMQAFADPVLSGHHATSMDKTFFNDDGSTLFGFNTPTIPSDPSSGSGLLGPVIQGASFEAPALNDTAPTTGGTSSAQMATAPITSSSRSVYQCQYCVKSYSRVGDLRRHSRSHNPNATKFSCPQAGCGRQFLRKDKLRDHRARKGH